MLDNCVFEDDTGTVSKIDCAHNNGLDYLDIEIFKMRQEPAQISMLTKASRDKMSISH